jgi:hypothetical protein
MLDFPPATRINIRMMTDKPHLPAPRLEAGPRTTVRPDRKGYGVGRSTRRPEEDVPAVDYLAKMQALGPRDGESLLAFTKRMAAIRAGRRLVLDAWENNFDKARVASAIGVPRNTLAYELRVIGLSAELLDARGINE